MLKDLFESLTKDKRIFSVYIIVICGLIFGATYAMRNNSLIIDLDVALLAVDEEAYGDTEFDASNLELRPILDENVETSINNVIKIEFTVGGAKTNKSEDIIYDIALANLYIDCDLISPYVKWKLLKDGNLLSSGSLDYTFDTIVDGRLVLTEIQQDLPAYSENENEYHNYTFYMWLSDSCQSDIDTCVSNEQIVDQSHLLGQYLEGRIEVELYTATKKPLVRKPNSSLDSSTCSQIEILPENKPKLDNDNLIPVYFDENKGEYGSWVKADSKNVDKTWYDYTDKRWANAVIVADDTKKTTYKNADIGTPINDTDITAFYVWIPRFKYRVWNINRQGGSESTYSYPAYSKGIQIKFENGTNSTGNVTCNYDDKTSDTPTYLSDNCFVNGTEILYNTSNLVYGESNQAWYTHPAFTFGTESDKEKTGFWIGKFEPSGNVNSNNVAVNPKIVPDVEILSSQAISEQFMTAKNFQKYLANSTMNAHMLTNLEWGAVAYLTHSIYGLCDNNTCDGINSNNSSKHYSGRSGGEIANESVSSYGTYNYKGYLLNDNTPTGTKDITKIASTTKNITGVYDLSGGASEYVMGNMVSESKAFFPSSSGTKWNDTKWYDNDNNKLHSEYYNSYSYGTTSIGSTAYNRARLGDATAEVLGNTTENSSWKVGSGISGAKSTFVDNDSPWFGRGGNSSNSYAGLFHFVGTNGENGNADTFRSALS